MAKMLTYRHNYFLLLIGSDPVCLDVVVEITQENEEEKKYSMKVISAQLAAEEEVLIEITKLMTTDVLAKFHSYLVTKLTEDMTPNLFSYFYSGT